MFTLEFTLTSKIGKVECRLGLNGVLDLLLSEIYAINLSTFLPSPHTLIQDFLVDVEVVFVKVVFVHGVPFMVFLHVALDFFDAAHFGLVRALPKLII